MIRAWAFRLDERGFVVARRPFLFTCHATGWALMVRERYGLHRDQVRVLEVTP